MRWEVRPIFGGFEGTACAAGRTFHAGGASFFKNEPVLLVFSVCEGEIILEKGEILSEKRQALICHVLQSSGYE